MSKLKMAAEAARRVAVPYKALIEAADEFDRVGALEEHEEGLKASIKASEEKLKSLGEQYIKADEAIVAAEGRAKQVMAAAEREAKSDREKAKAYAKEKTEKADAEAKAILQKAMDASAAAAKERSDQLAAMSRQLVASQEALDQAQKGRDALKAEAAKLESQIAEARATIERMMGAAK